MQQHLLLILLRLDDEHAEQIAQLGVPGLDGTEAERFQHGAQKRGRRVRQPVDLPEAAAAPAPIDREPQRRRFTDTLGPDQGESRPADFETSFEEIAAEPPLPSLEDDSLKPLRSQPWTEGTVLPPRKTRPTSIDRLDFVRGHLARIQRQGLSPAERREIVRLLTLIQQDIASLLAALGADEETRG